MHADCEFCIKKDICRELDRINCPPPPIYIGPVKVKSLKERLEETKMKKATSVQSIKNVKDISVTIENNPVEMESKITIVASTDDDIFEFEFEGPDLLQSCKAAGLFSGLEKDQTIKELEKELGDWKIEAADCLKLRDGIRREKNREINELKQQLQQAEHDKKRLTWKNEELEKKISELEALKTPTIENFADEEYSDQPKADNVNHPSHYETGKFECIEVMQEVFGTAAVMSFCKCNAFKYVYRMDRKNGTEDAKKAIWYLNKYLELYDKLTDEILDERKQRHGYRRYVNGGYKNGGKKSIPEGE